MGTVNEDIADAVTDSHLWMLRYEVGTVQDLQREYDELVGPWWARVEELRQAARDGVLTADELDELRELGAAFDDAIRAYQAVAAPMLDEAIYATMESALSSTASDVAGHLPPELSAGFGKVAQVDQVVAALGDVGGPHWASKLDDALFEQRNRVQAILLEAATRGASMPKIARTMEQLTDIPETYKGRYANIARTEMQRVSNEAARQVFMANLDVIKAIQYLATLDSRTCPICGPDHDRIYTYDKSGVPLDDKGVEAPRLPRHPRCRCFYAPVTRSWEELGLAPKGSGMDGKPSSGMTYPEWFGRRTADQQREILGKSRYDMWSSGAVELEDFAEGDRLLTLTELRARFAA